MRHPCIGQLLDSTMDTSLLRRVQLSRNETGVSFKQASVQQPAGTETMGSCQRGLGPALREECRFLWELLVYTDILVG